ncbi:MAG TPA: formylglycine-generating enzyme family protein [Pseudomonadota bacterium]|nr:formylglycine-generating enzyme family protein [Pseudomonadota bacterium]
MNTAPSRLPSHPFWTWPCRLLGGGLLVISGLGPLVGLYRRSEQAAPRQQIVEETAPASPRLRPKMLHLPPGTFLMGSTNYSLEQPVHLVQITHAFGLSETEVTQAQYQAVMGENPSYFKENQDSAQRPVEQVSWFDAVRYCNKLSERERLIPCYQINGNDVRWLDVHCPGYRLPTEAEWEYAARADHPKEYAGSDDVDAVAWYGRNTRGETHPVATRQRNSWFLHDLSGNVWEWVWDWYADSYSYAGAEKPDPLGPQQGGNRVLRGGSCVSEADYVRAAFRYRSTPSDRGRNIGFRLAKSLP